MKTSITHHVRPISILLALRVALPTMCADFFDHITPVSLYTQIVETCMRMISDSTKNYDESTQVDLCVGRLIRLTTATSILAQKPSTSSHLHESDVKYLMSLTFIAQTKQQQILSKSAYGLSLMNSAQAHIARMLEPQ